MKGSDWESPRRMHPYALLFEAVEVGRGWLIPALIGGASMGGGHMGRMVTWGIVLFAAPTLVFAVAEHFALRYRIAGGELVVDSGVLNRRHRVIPLSRIQNLELRQGALQRALGVAELRVETGGGEGEEPVPLVLDEGEAEQLRGELLARRSSEHADDASPAPTPEPLAHLSTRDLVLAGGTANEAGLIAAALIGGVELAYQLPLPLPRIPLDPREMLPELPFLGLALLGLTMAVAFLFLATLLSIAGALVRYWDFVLVRADGELHKRYGCLDRRSVTVPLARIQALRIEESLLRRPLGLASLRIETASVHAGEGKRGGAEAFLPLVRVRSVPRIAAAVLHGFDYSNVEFRPVHPYARRRAFYRYAAVGLAVTTGAVALLGPKGLWLLLLLFVAAFAAQAHYRHLGYALVPGHVVIRAGVWNRVTWIIPERKIQTLHLIETPFQRRREVATLVADTAAGEAKVPDVPRAEAPAFLSLVPKRVTPGEGSSVGRVLYGE